MHEKLVSIGDDFWIETEDGEFWSGDRLIGFTRILNTQAKGMR
jgi:hypothetical protein